MPKFNKAKPNQHSSKKRGYRNTLGNRKKRRKEERKAKKAKKHSYYINKSSRNNEIQIKAETADKPGSPHIRPVLGDKSKPKISGSPPANAIKTKMAKVKNRRKITPGDVRKLQLKEANEQDEKAIKRLEKQLKLNKRRKKNTLPKSFAEDGLGYVLEILDQPQNLKAEGHLSDVESEISDDLARAVGKKVSSDQSDSGDEVDPFFDTTNQSQPDGGNVKSISTLNAKSSNNQEEISSSEEDGGGSEEEESNQDVENTGEIMLSSLKEYSGGKSSSSSFKKLQSNDQDESLKFLEESDDSECDKQTVSDGETLQNDSDYEELSKKSNVKRRANESSESVISGQNVAKRRRTDSVSSLEASSESEDKITEKTEYWEDIYGRLRDKKGNVVKLTEPSGIKYIPPAKRAQPVDGKKNLQLERLRRQLKGLLNRLSESNVQPISNQIEAMHMNHSRNDMNESLISLILESVVSKALTPERLVMENALLVALLHANVGTEIGANFLQSVVKHLDCFLKKGGNYGEGKECDNLLMLILHLCTFKVAHSVLIFDILKKFTETFHEKDIELILLTLRSVGFQLRRDNPLALKELIVSLQSKAASCQHDQARIRFMLETVMAIRNNNMHKIPNYDPSLAEHSKKVLRGYIRKGCYVQELCISLEDLLSSEERGRWWIVGSAWSGKTEQGVKGDAGLRTRVSSTNVGEKILDLAARQRMNTDVRKAIFCLMMTAEDYMDAFEKILHLNLKNRQEQEIIHVVLDCCLQEKNFNRFYALLMQKLCQFDRQLQMTLQFSLWDKFKELDKMHARQVTNMAHLLVDLFLDDALPLSVLKAVHLSEMDKPLVKFLRQVFLGLLLHDSEETCRKVFARIAPAPKLQMLREGLRLFMRHFLLRNKDKFGSAVAEKLAVRVEMAEAALLSADKKLRL